MSSNFEAPGEVSPEFIEGEFIELSKGPGLAKRILFCEISAKAFVVEIPVMVYENISPNGLRARILRYREFTEESAIKASVVSTDLSTITRKNGLRARIIRCESVNVSD